MTKLTSFRERFPFPVPPVPYYCLSMPFPYEEFNLSGVRTYPLASRKSKVRAEDFAKPCPRGATFKGWLDSLPNILGAADIRRVVDAIVAARERGAGIVWGIG